MVDWNVLLTSGIPASAVRSVTQPLNKGGCKAKGYSNQKNALTTASPLAIRSGWKSTGAPSMSLEVLNQHIQVALAC